MQFERFIPYALLTAGLALLFTPTVEHNYPATVTPQPAPAPPQPPVIETFQAAPQLSLFPRLGDYRPEDGDERLPFWNTYREHLLKISGVIIADQASGNRAFSFRGINGIDSIGHFSPLAVSPNKSYRLKLKLKTELTEEATAGVGLLEFSEFLWLGEQYPESLQKQFYLASKELLRVQETAGWQEFEQTFTTGPQTRMIHLIFFREGSATDRQQVLVDDIVLETAN